MKYLLMLMLVISTALVAQEDGKVEKIVKKTHAYEHGKYCYDHVKEDCKKTKRKVKIVTKAIKKVF